MKTQQRLLLLLSVVGLVVPNGLFLYHAFSNLAVLREALTNPVALVFIAEAFFLMLLFAIIIQRLGFRSPGWIAFIVMSLLGSMAFSVPAFLFLLSRKRGSSDPLQKS